MQVNVFILEGPPKTLDHPVVNPAPFAIIAFYVSNLRSVQESFLGATISFFASQQ